jgi:hypothetical protein
MADAGLSREVLEVVFPVNIGYPTHTLPEPELPL